MVQLPHLDLAGQLLARALDAGGQVLGLAPVQDVDVGMAAFGVVGGGDVQVREGVPALQDVGGGVNRS
jgi:hypothetical protein